MILFEFFRFTFSYPAEDCTMRLGQRNRNVDTPG